MNLRSAVAWCVVAGALGPSGVGCAAPPAATPGAQAPTSGIQLESVDHEPCTTQGHKVELFDTRGDGKSVVTKVFDGSGHEICRITDINHDGKADLYEYFDAAGAVRRREADYDANGTIDAVESFEGGKLVKRELDTTGQHRVDTWDYYDKASGKRIRRERDTTNDGRVDQWWTWEGDKITIAVDRNGDGQPDPAGTLYMDDKTGLPREAKAEAPPAPSAAPAPEGPPPPSAPPSTPAPSAAAAAPAPAPAAPPPSKPGAAK